MVCRLDLACPVLLLYGSVDGIGDEIKILFLNPMRTAITALQLGDTLREVWLPREVIISWKFAYLVYSNRHIYS